jgi:acetyl-CoA synthetase
LATGLIGGELEFSGRYDTGDLARTMPDGKIIIQGRSELVGSDFPLAAVEAVVAAHPDVAEAAAVASGEQVVVYATLRAEAAEPYGIEDVLTDVVRKEVEGPDFPLVIRVVEELPKTRSGKIARQALRGAAEGRMGDVSGLADPSVMTALLDGKDSLF